jgi:hypothetical protein
MRGFEGRGLGQMKGSAVRDWGARQSPNSSQEPLRLGIFVRRTFRASATSAAVRPAKLPGTQCLFYLVEREVVLPNGLRYIGLSVQAESRSLLAESEKEPGGQPSQAGLADPKIKARLAELDGTAFVGSPADFSKLIADETEKWAKVIRAANIKPE